MEYRELESICQNWAGKVCIFGAGKIGRSWGYDILQEAGFDIDFYCDNYVKPGTVIRDNIRSISLDELYQYKEKVLVFVTVIEKRHIQIRRQLETHGIKNIIVMGYLFMQDIIESVCAAKDSKVFLKYENIVDDETFIKEQFKFRNGYALDLKNPQTYNEKLQWLKLYYYNPQYIKMVDKYEMKKFIEDKIGNGYTIPVLGVWENFTAVDFGGLPKKFVMKCTHDSGSIMICRDKEEMDKEQFKYVLNSSIRFNYFWAGREWPYKDVKRRILVEEYLCDSSGKELTDYKFFCFNGAVELIQVDFDRFTGHRRNMYDREWNYIPLTIEYPTMPEKIIEKPRCLEEMIRIAGCLSAGIPHVRVDFYIINEKPIVGEMTFFHGGGQERFEPAEWNYKLGSMIKLKC